MGQSFSNGNNLYVHVDRPYYSPGNPVNGQVLLNCVTPFQASALVLKIEGYERTHWQEHVQHKHYDSGRKTWVEHTEMRAHNGRREIFKIKVPLVAYASLVQPGQYQFPFGCILPMNIPGSFEYRGGYGHSGGHQHSNVHGKIRYKVKVECEVPGMLTANLRAKQNITVHQGMDRPPSQIVREDQQMVKACCCCDKGYAYITAHVEADSYLPGETAYALLQIDNQSTAEFKAVCLELHRHITLTSDGGHRHEHNEKLASYDMPGVKPGEKLMGVDARRVQLQLPVGLQSSAFGYIVQCAYTLEIRLKAPMHIADPRLKLPITIYQAVPQYQAYDAPPPYWQPTVVGEVVSVPMPSAPPMPPPGQVMGEPAAYAWPAAPKVV